MFFVPLMERGRLREAARYLCGVSPRQEPELYLWGLRVTERVGGSEEIFPWLKATRSILERGIANLAPAAAGGGLWILWPKKASGVATDLSENVVRETGLAAGLVDFKVAAIDAIWSGLRFSIAKGRSK